MRIAKQPRPEKAVIEGVTNLGSHEIRSKRGK
jgi:hypothetical protein